MHIQDLMIPYNDINCIISTKLLNGEKILIIKSNDENTEKENCLLNYYAKYIYKMDTVNINLNDVIELFQKKQDNICIEDEMIVRKALLVNREVQTKLRKVLDIYDFFVSKTENDESLVNLYSFTNDKLNVNSKNYKYYNFLTNQKEFINKNKKYIDIAIKEELNNKLIKSFIKYKRFEKNNLFKIINKDVTIAEIDKTILKLKGLLNNSFALSPPVFINEYTESFLKTISNVETITEEEIFELAKKAYYNHPNREIVHKTAIIWYKPSTLISYLLNNKKYKIYKYEEEKCQLQIFNEYKENIDNLKLFMRSFNFLSLVINNDHLAKIQSCLLKEDDLWNYLNNLERSMNIYKQYKIIKDSILSLNNVTLALIELCYTKFKSYKELISVLEFIPIFYKYELITALENRDKLIIDNYNKFSKYITELLITIKHQKKLMTSALEFIVRKNKIKTMEENNIELIIHNESTLLNEFKEEFHKCLQLLFNIYPIVIVNSNTSNEFISKYGVLFNEIYQENELINQYEINKRLLYNDDINYRLKSIVIKLILSLGYKIVKNYKFNETYLDIIVMSPKNEQKFITVYFDNLQYFGLDNINYLLWLKNLNIEVIYIWSRDWWSDKNVEISRLKYSLKKYLD